VVTGQTAVALTGGSNASLVYAARTPGGVVLVDLGWWGHERAVARALADLGAGPADVTDVFLTHAHRDHVAAWRTVRHARFHLPRPSPTASPDARARAAGSRAVRSACGRRGSRGRARSRCARSRPTPRSSSAPG
jgi:glyoxylase-like metal-dependent hydrolase (beta-lactamase superfamily II)